MREKLKAIMDLAKIKITIAVSITTVTGYVLYFHGFSWQIFLPTLGIFLLACGSSAINHIQEYKTDKKMARTRNRPLPSGKMSLSEAWLTAVLFVIAGSLLLWFTSNLAGFILGLIALVWYNLIYTFLKKVTYYAVIPGSVIGCIPPLVGWVSAGGPLWDIRCLVIAFFFFVWQVPHFWLLMLKYGKQYQEAGFPSITNKNLLITRLMTYIWVIVTAISAVFLPFFHIISSEIAIYGIILSSIWLLYQFTRMMFLKADDFIPVKYFMKINYYVLMVTLFLVTDHLFVHA